MGLARTAAPLVACIALTQVTACSPTYGVQAAAGQFAIIGAGRPVTEVRADPLTPENLRLRLDTVEDALTFAHGRLGLPDNGSYRDYVDIGRPYVVWNVYAAGEFSVRLRSWCFPVAGCVAYRGYFREAAAREFAAREVQRGYEVAVIGAAAYSTLGFFRDPLLSSAVHLPETALAGLIFHELAHQLLYVPGDTTFNESFATLVEQEGVWRWLEDRGEQALLCRYARGLEREREVHRLLRETRRRLAQLYASGKTADAMRAEKREEFARLRSSYAQLRAGWREPPYFDAWFDDRLNNARLGALAAYDDHVGVLRVVLESGNGDLVAFYRRTARLARLAADDRAAVLDEIRTPGFRDPDDACGAAPRPASANLQ